MKCGSEKNDKLRGIRGKIRWWQIVFFWAKQSTVLSYKIEIKSVEKWDKTILQLLNSKIPKTRSHTVYKNFERRQEMSVCTCLIHLLSARNELK